MEFVIGADCGTAEGSDGATELMANGLPSLSLLVAGAIGVGGEGKSEADTGDGDNDVGGD